MVALPPDRQTHAGEVPLPNAVLAALSIDELQAVLCFIDESERAGRLNREAAFRWRCQIADWHRFRCVSCTGTPSNLN